MNEILDYEGLRDKHRAVRDEFSEQANLRIHRAISWIGGAENCVDDEDARFIFLWIAFNAVYADESAFLERDINARSSFHEFFRKIVSLDGEKLIYGALWERFSGPVRLLMDNRYVYSPFWKYHNGIKGFEMWESMLDKETRRFSRAFQNGETALVLGLVFGRLYVLRNQIVHGGSTWKSSVNRDQVRDGAAILGFLMPAFADIMMDNPDQDWGKPFYPVVD